MRICLVYDCLFPYTVGGAERWYRNLARAARRGGTRGHIPDPSPVGPRRARARCRRVDVVSVGPRMGLYAAPGRRRILPPLVFGLGVLWHLLRHGRRYDVVHTASFPYFSLLAAGLASDARSIPAVRGLVRGVDPRLLDRAISARSAAGSGTPCSPSALRVPHRAFCFSRLHARRLVDARVSGASRRSSTACTTGRSSRSVPEPTEPLVDVRRAAHPGEASARARAGDRGSRGARRATCARVIFGDGPERERCAALVDELGLDEVVSLPGLRRRGGGRARAARRWLHGLAVEPRGLRHDRGRGRRGRDAERRRPRRRQRRDGADRGGRERLHRPVRITGGPCRSHPARAVGRRGAASLHRRLVRRRTPSGSRSSPRSKRSRAPTQQDG